VEDAEKKALEEIRNRLSQLDSVREDVHRIRMVMESKDSLTPRFLECSPQIRTYSGMIAGLFEERHGGIGEADIYILGYFDQLMLDKLLPRARFVNIVSPKNALEQRRNRDALTRISKAGAKVRTHPMLHARVFCIPERRFLIIGSGDLQTDWYGGTRFDAGIYSNYPDLMKSAIDFFKRVWEESDPLPE
jgi:hypothetical protein